MPRTTNWVLNQDIVSIARSDAVENMLRVANREAQMDRRTERI